MNNLFRKTNITDKPNKYEKLGFTVNPFPISPGVKLNSPDYRDNGSIFYQELRESEKQEFKNIVINKPQTVSLLMDYATFQGRGIGKTAFLNFMKKSINKDLGNDISDGENILFAIYITPDGAEKARKWWQIMRLIFNAIKEDEMINYVFARLRFMTGCLSEDILSKITTENLSDTLLSDSWLMENNLTETDINNMNNSLRKILKDNGIDLQLTLNLSYKNTFDDFRDKLFLVEDSDTFWRKKGTELVFDTLARLFHISGFSNCVLMFDELEKIIYNQNTAEKRDFCDSLRTFFIDGNNYNANQRFFKILLTIHPNSQQLLIEHWQAAGLDRFCDLAGEKAKYSTVFFRPIEKNEFITPLAEAYLDKAQIDAAPKGIEPFTEDALVFAFNESNRVLGKYLELLYKAIEDAVAEDRTKITQTDIENISKAKVINSPNIESKALPDTVLNLMD